ncbi:protein kinase domain-containing protein [Nitrosomonas sp. Is37]|uniref:protein kinase domain-containing protein n=1 Tax=Nitrosomonas sp. Is37 TaxID=3080535 RepID=UPI00294B2991|nr:serine/threonine protein kinase [Nitrosomonas sp. Is37]MDV6344919.1 serine/threonine protein kinase [Nitrosomonas sp. Is37]
MAYIHDQILPEGTQIGVFEIKDTLKIGAFDIIYRGWNRHLKEQVEIHEYFPHDFAIRASNGLGVEPKSPNDKENFEYGLKVFLNQAEILTQIEHPNVAAVEIILQLNGTAYTIMAQQEGVSLASLVQSATTIAETELKFILVSILNALQKVHECKIVHSGIQPAAIFLGKKGEPLLIHFSAARLAIAARTPNLTSELAAGYAPAEQYEQADVPGPATDFYALGATLYHCMTHTPPVDAQNRIMVLSKGEPDPMVLLSGSADITYSAELLQAINWMLRPDYNDRPQTAAEILTLLKSTHTEGQSKPASTQQKVVDDTESSAGAKRFIGMGVLIGIIATIVAGLWFSKKASESFEEQLNIAAQPPVEHHSDQTSVAPESPEDQAVALTSNPASQPEKGQIPENTSSPAASISVPEAEPQDDVATEPESNVNQQQTVIESLLPQSASQNLPEKPLNVDSIKAYLAAAEKAMKAVRFTTPQSDNAYKYYQMVLAIDPNNREAHFGLQKIVDRYVQFITKARADGRLNEAKLYLQRAESVLPDDAKLHRIRAELAVAKK